MAQLSSQPAKPMLMWLDYREHMKRMLGYIFNYQQFTDCRLVVPGGKVYANRAILSMASSFFENIFSSASPLSAGQAADVPTVLIPDLTFSTLRVVIQFIYTGSVTLHSTEMLPFMEACHMLQIRGVECYDNVVMGIFIEGSTGGGMETARASSVLSSESTSNNPNSMDDGEPEHDVQTMVWSEEPSETMPLDEVLIKIEPCDAHETEEQQDPFRKDDGKTQAETPMARGKVLKTYATCLTAAIVAVMNGGMTLRKAGVLYHVLCHKLGDWTQRVERAVRSQASDDTSTLQSPVAEATIETVLEQSKRDVNDILDGVDESVKAVILSKRRHTVTYDARLMAAQDQILQKCVTVSAASMRYNIPEKVITNRLHPVISGPSPNCSTKQTHVRWQPKQSPVSIRNKATLAMFRRIYTPERLASLKEAIRAIVVDGKSGKLMSRTHGFANQVLYRHARNVAVQTRSNRSGDPRSFAERVDAAIDEMLGTEKKDESQKSPLPNNPPIQLPPLVPIVPNASRLGKLYWGQNDRGSLTARVKQAASAVATGQMQYPEASRAFRLNKSSIFRYVQKLNHQSVRTPAPTASKTSERLSATVVPEVHQEDSTENDVPTASKSDVSLEIPELIPFSVDDRLTAAVKAITERGMSYREASLRYDISKVALWRKIGKQNRDDRVQVERE
uniref:BTB domain-containing protein n=1 Tax=Anopheles farauti TaxID=69004 RepID=A0A182QKA9_9DIPT